MSAFAFDPSSIPPAIANRVLERETWALSCLAAHAGSTITVTIGPLAATMRVDAGGKLESAHRRPDLELSFRR
jgi:hypothetical protein